MPVPARQRARAAARCWSCSPTVKVLPATAVVQWDRAGQSLHRVPKVAVPRGVMCTRWPSGHVTVLMIDGEVVAAELVGVEFPVAGQRPGLDDRSVPGCFEVVADRP